MLFPLRKHAALAAALAALLSGCSNGSTDPSSSGHSCGLSVLGDKTKPIEIGLTVRELDGVSRLLDEGDTVPMILPPQGGRVIFAGVVATNIDPCAVTLSGALRDLSTMQLRLDARTINLTPVPGKDGWGGSDEEDISTFSNVPVCPNQWSKTDLYGTPYELSISLTDRDNRTAMRTMKVVPACAEPDNQSECLCICKGGYVLGQMCSPMVDGGADGSAMDGGG